MEETCDKKCRDLVGGMHMLKGDALEAIWRDYNTTGERLWSSVVYFPEIPDMWFVNFLKQRLFFNAAVQAARDTCFWQKILTRKLRQQYVQIRELVETFKNDV